MVASPRKQRRALHHGIARLERPFGFGGEPVTTSALGDLISVALPSPPRVDGCLAVAVQIYGDNPDEVTGATLNGGDTGGTWTKAGELLGVTGGPDGGLAVFVTEMPTAGMISGGSVNPNPTTPVNSVSLTFGFFLRGKLV